MYLLKDKRKTGNVLLFASIWILGGTFLWFQFHVEDANAKKAWDEWCPMAAAQVISYKDIPSGTDPSFLRGEFVRMVQIRAGDMAPSELGALRNWVDKNIDLTTPHWEYSMLLARVSSLSFQTMPIIKRGYPAHKNILQIWAWGACALVYLFFTSVLYAVSPLAAIETEPQLNVVDVGLIGIGCGISGGVASPIAFGWFPLYAISAVVVVKDILATQIHRWAKNSPWFLAFLITLFWDTFPGNPSTEYWLRYCVFVFVFFVMMYAVLLVLARPHVAEGA